MSYTYEERALFSDTCLKHYKIICLEPYKTISEHDIVQDSIEFTDSICSQDELKFGLCEAAYFSCQIYGDYDLVGKDISVEIQFKDNNPLYDEWYTATLGKFRVESLKKIDNHGLRQLEAFEMSGARVILSGFEQFRRSIPVFSNVPDVIDAQTLINTSMGFLPPPKPHDSHVPWVARSDASVPKESGDYLVVRYYEYILDCSVDSAIYYIDADKMNDYDQNLPRIKQLFSIYNFGLKADEIEEYLTPRVTHTIYDSAFYSSSKYLLKMREPIFGYINGFQNLASGHGQKMSIRMPYNISVLSRYSEQPLETYDLYESAYDSLHVYSPIITLKYNPSIKTERELITLGSRTGASADVYRIPEKNLQNIKLIDYVNDILEVNASFVRLDEKGKVDICTLDDGGKAIYPRTDLFPKSNLYPKFCKEIKEVLSSQIKDVLYEDFTTKQYGYVRVAYQNEENQLTSFTIKCDSSKPNVYDMTNNKLFTSQIWDESIIEDIIKNYFYPKLSGVSYTPCDLTMMGMPLWKAGTPIKVNMSDNSFKTYIMRRTLSGAPSLTDNITSNGLEETENASAWRVVSEDHSSNSNPEYGEIIGVI